MDAGINGPEVSGGDSRFHGNDVGEAENGEVTEGNDEEPGLLTLRAGNGTANFAREPAMSLEQAELSISNGVEVAGDWRAGARTWSPVATWASATPAPRRQFAPP